MADVADIKIPSRTRGMLNVKDTIESVVVAFILAFIFRAFIAEAFVIPTGSMAPNLLGVHRDHTCSVCGTSYAYGFSPMADGRLRPPSDLVCPNCGYHPSDHLTMNPDNGDRIFVLKWLFDIGRLLPEVDPEGPGAWWHLFKPCRWDVVVFKDPNDGTTNFIKRLVGLPGEVLEIIDGDVYTAGADDLMATPAGESLLRKLELSRATYDQLAPPERDALDHALKIRRKTRRSQRSLWLSVYDHDFLPVNKPSLAGWVPLPSRDESDWDTDQRRLRFTPTRDRGLQEIEFARDLGEPHGRPPVTDLYAYNGSRDTYIGPSERDQIEVSDVRLRCVIVPGSGEGEVALSLSKRDDRFVATFDSRGSVRLERRSVTHVNEPVSKLAEATIKPFEPGKPVELMISNADYRVSVSVGGSELLATTDEQYPILPANGPTSLAAFARGLPINGLNASPQIRIGAAGMPVECRHVCIERDVYYRSPRIRGETRGWGVQGRPVYLRNRPEQDIKEYYCLGDNSPLSKDGRLWNHVGPHLVGEAMRNEYQLGTVPADQMIGRAFLVYWPAGYPLVHGKLPLVPNAGEMRLIR